MPSHELCIQDCCVIMHSSFYEKILKEICNSSLCSFYFSCLTTFTSKSCGFSRNKPNQTVERDRKRHVTEHESAGSRECKTTLNTEAVAHYTATIACSNEPASLQQRASFFLPVREVHPVRREDREVLQHQSKKLPMARTQ